MFINGLQVKKLISPDQLESLEDKIQPGNPKGFLMNNL